MNKHARHEKAAKPLERSGLHRELWERYKQYLNVNKDIGLTLDVSRMKFPLDYFDSMEERIQKAFLDMESLEGGAPANPDEQRMVGHYWLRNPALAPNPEIARNIQDTVQAIKGFAHEVHQGVITAPGNKRFSRLLVIGIGGSALGPQFVSAALQTSSSPMAAYFLDNTDPDGFDTILNALGDGLEETMTIVISKSGSTKETRNGMLEARAAYEGRRLVFAKHAVAITGEGSELDHLARTEGWLAVFPMWDWVGGRTSETSAVGLLPAALQGIDIHALLTGARLCDQATRKKETLANPAALLALMWFLATGGRGEKDMIILPYKDRLQLFAKYLQQLVMESLGKEKDLDGKTVCQGIAVYGNKGSTDQHAYVQQLREGVNNFFVTFIEVKKDREGKSHQVEDDVTSGDYLHGFLQGTRRALYENDRQSLTITIESLDARSVGVLIALYERTVGLYASLINVNAYHQPGVEAGKRAAELVIGLQKTTLAWLRARPDAALTTEEIAAAVGAPEEVEILFKLLEHAAANPDHGIKKLPSALPWNARYRYDAGSADPGN